jgi:hypothetical protein
MPHTEENADEAGKNGVNSLVSRGDFSDGASRENGTDSSVPHGEVNEGEPQENGSSPPEASDQTGAVCL